MEAVYDVLALFCNCCPPEYVGLAYFRKGVLPLCLQLRDTELRVAFNTHFLLTLVCVMLIQGVHAWKGVHAWYADIPVHSMQYISYM